MRIPLRGVWSTSEEKVKKVEKVKKIKAQCEVGPRGWAVSTFVASVLASLAAYALPRSVASPTRLMASPSRSMAAPLGPLLYPLKHGEFFEAADEDLVALQG